MVLCNTTLRHSCSLGAHFHSVPATLARFVELPDELALEAVLHEVDQEEHHGLGNAATRRGKKVRWLPRSHPPDGGVLLCNRQNFAPESWRGGMMKAECININAT